MAIRSMTGFARCDGGIDQTTWHWEIRSVNGRGLDMRVRLPGGLEAIEPAARAAIGSAVVRGNISANLHLQRPSNSVEVRLDEQNLEQVVQAAERVRELTGAAPPTAEALLAVKGVLEIVEKEEDPETVERRNARIVEDLQQALISLVDARRQEGEKLARVIGQQVDEIERLAAAAEASPSRQPDTIAERLGQQVATLMEASHSFDRDRLHQEAAMLATKADIAEELDRIKTHVSAAREMLEAGSPIGRKFDFLTQEFNREANTLCSKSNHIDVSRCGLAMKVAIDQMREQVQNIE